METITATSIPNGAAVETALGSTNLPLTLVARPQVDVTPRLSERGVASGWPRVLTAMTSSSTTASNARILSTA